MGEGRSRRSHGQIERGLFSWMLHEDQKSSQSGKEKKILGFRVFLFVSGWKEHSISHGAVSRQASQKDDRWKYRARKNGYSRVDIVETVEILQHAITET